MTIQPVSRPDPRDATSGEYRGLGALAILAALVFLLIAVPVGTGVFLGALVAFTIHPLHVAIRQRTGRNNLAAFVCAALAWLGLTGGIGGVFYLLIDRGVTLARELPAALAPGGTLDQAANDASEKLRSVGLHSDALDHHLHHGAEEASSYAGRFATTAASLTLSLTVALFFTVVTVYCVLSRWARLAHWTEALLPLRPIHTRELLTELRSLGREIMLGTVVVGLIQGVLGGVAYAALGVPLPAFFGAMTAIASTIPAFGTLLVWGPLAAYLIATGHAVAGIVLLLWGFFVVVTLSDGFLRPTVLGRHSHLGFLPALIGIFGGIELFGFVGLLLGPTLVGLALAILRLYARGRGRRARKHQEAMAARVGDATTDA
jgi:predicted PurR-regulated permease PerM